MYIKKKIQNFLINSDSNMKANPPVCECSSWWYVERLQLVRVFVWLRDCESCQPAAVENFCSCLGFVLWPLRPRWRVGVNLRHFSLVCAWVCEEQESRNVFQGARLCVKGSVSVLVCVWLFVHTSASWTGGRGEGGVGCEVKEVDRKRQLMVSSIGGRKAGKTRTCKLGLKPLWS